MIGGNVTEKITPETYIKMNEEFEEEGTPISIIVPTQEQIDNSIGVKLPTTFKPQKPMITDGSDPWPHSKCEPMTDPREENEEKWRIATNKVIAENLVEKIEELLDGKAHYFECSDRTTYHQKIVIEFNHKSK